MCNYVPKKRLEGNFRFFGDYANNSKCEKDGIISKIQGHDNHSNQSHKKENISRHRSL